MVVTAVSLFAGVGGFDLALERNGVKVVASAEIDKHARSVLAKHFPDAVQYDDVRKVTADGLRTAGFIPERGIITGGFPCQDLSVAGKRAGLVGARSGLFYEIARIADETKAKWLILENVPGLLTSQRGADMGAVVGTLVELGYGVAWRVLDAQHFGVPQRRRRVFIVAERSGDPARAAQILFERTSVRGDTTQGRAQGQDTPRGAGQGAAEPTGFNAYAGIDIQAQVGSSTALKVSDGGGVCNGLTCERGGDYELPASRALPQRHGGQSGCEQRSSDYYNFQGFGAYASGDTASTMKARDYKDATDLVVQRA